MHLDPRTYAGLLDGTLPPAEARALAEHLSGDCETCERFLAARDRADELDGLGDAAIDLAFPPTPVGVDDLAFARVQRSLRPAAGRRRLLLTVGAIAASLVVAAVAGTLVRRAGSPAEEAWDGVKGTAPRAAELHLRIARLDEAGAVVRASSGDRLVPATRLVFEVESGRGAVVALARVAPDGLAELLWQDRVVAGRTVVGSGGRAAAYPLSGLAGRQRFVVVAGEGLDRSRAEEAARAFAAGRQPAPGSPDGLVYDAVDVDVR